MATLRENWVDEVWPCFDKSLFLVHSRHKRYYVTNLKAVYNRSYNVTLKS